MNRANLSGLKADILLLVVFGICGYCVNSQKDIPKPSMNDTLLKAMIDSTDEIVPASSVNKTMIKMATAMPETSLRCGSISHLVDECFKDLPPHLMEFLQTTKIAINEAEIASKCNIFHRGMKCFDDYTLRCLTDRDINFYKNNVEGARKFFNKFCNDREFQRDYLQHKDCFSHIQEDWKRCTKEFQHILTEELHTDGRNVTHKFMEFCCARHAYENCIYNSARFKCYKHSAKFARDTAKMLSDEKHFSNCRQYENVLCVNGGSSNRLVDGFASRIWYLVLMLVLARRIMS